LNIGARTIKTGIAVALSVYLCYLLGIEVSLFSAASAVVCMQQSIGKGLKNGVQEISTNAIAAVVAIILGLTIPIEFLSMAMATIIMILICNRLFAAKNQIVLGVIAAIFILASPQEQFINHAVERFIALLIGIVVANIINLILFPPKYKEVLLDKMIRLNNLAIQEFFDSINRYVNQNPASDEELQKKQADYSNLLRSTEKLFDLYQYDWNFNLPGKGNSKEKDRLQLFREYMLYNQGLWQRSKDVHFLAEERKVRRVEANDPDISKEFQRIFEMLSNVMFTASSYNMELQKKIRGEESVIYPEPKVWSRFNKTLNEWQENTAANNFFTHALIEVSVVTYNIRWFAKESARLLKL